MFFIDSVKHPSDRVIICGRKLLLTLLRRIRAERFTIRRFLPGLLLLWFVSEFLLLILVSSNFAIALMVRLGKSLVGRSCFHSGPSSHEFSDSDCANGPPSPVLSSSDSIRSEQSAEVILQKLHSRALGTLRAGSDEAIL